MEPHQLQKLLVRRKRRIPWPDDCVRRGRQVDIGQRRSRGKRPRQMDPDRRRDMPNGAGHPRQGNDVVVGRYEERKAARNTERNY